MLPSSLTRRRLSAALAALAAVALAGPVSGASASPRLKSAGAMDADSDGRVDGFKLAFSARVKGRATPRFFRVSGFRVTRVERPRGRRVRLRVAEQAGCDLGARPKVSYRPGRRGPLTGARGGRVRRTSVNMAKRHRGAPRLTCAVTSDGDGDGHVDAVVLTYSRPVRNRAQTTGPFPFEVDRFAIRRVDRARGRNLTLRVRERPGYDTDDLPAVIYRRPTRGTARRYAVTSRSGRVRSSTFNATRDRAAAVLVSTSTADADQDGLLDGVSARFSEPVSGAARSFTVAGASVTGVSGSGRERITARIAEGALGTGARPTLGYGARGLLLRDAAANNSRAGSSRPADGAAPVITAARTEDRSGAAGRLDTLVLAFSENVSHAADDDGSYPFGVTGYSVASAGPATGTGLELTLVEGSTPDTGTHPPVGYTRGIGTPVRDAAGNEAVSGAFAGTTDGVIPRLVSASTVDADVDGRVDAVTFDFSETVRHAARSCPGCSFALSGGGLVPQSAGAATGSSVQVAVAESSFNSGVRPLATYSPANGGVTDESGNVALASTTTAGDGAPPVAVGAHTADVDADARIDRLVTTFSEPMSHAGDAIAPFSVAAEGYALDSVDAASGNSLTLRLHESVTPDTGSAPALSYSGGGGVALRDANGTEHASRSYPGLTRDAVAPVYLGATTADADATAGNVPGRIDAVELRYSEQLQGTAGAAPFTVSGHAIESAAYGADRVSIRIAEGPAPDTADTPDVSYTPPGSPGNPARLRDLAEGAGDTADEAPPIASEAASDGAGPAIVAGQSGDSDADGRVDTMATTFSEPVSVAPGLGQVIGLSSPSLPVTAVAQTGPTVLTATSDEPAGSADGDLRPSVTVSQPGRVTDAAANAARGETFAGAADGVRPVMLSARSGEVSGSDCSTLPVDGSVDCVRAAWSEPVQPAAGPGAFDVTPFPESGVLVSSPGASHTDLTVTEGTTPDRDRTGSVSYTGGASDEVTDVAGNLALNGTTVITRVCIDSAHSEPNDAFAPENPVLTDPVPQQALCAADPDWFRVSSLASGRLDVGMDPGTGLSTTLEVVDSTGTPVPGGSATSPSPGAAAEVHLTGLSPSTTYWLHVSAPLPQEGDYCLDVTPQPGEQCDAGEPLPG